MITKFEVFYTWQEVSDDCILLAKKIETIKSEIQNIYGLPRGGLVPAVILSHLLSRPVILREEMIDGRTLLVDDVSDTGEQLLRLLDKKPRAIATLWVHAQTKVKPDFSIRRKYKRWIHFPWEPGK